MRILVNGESWPKLSFAADEGASYPPPLLGFRVGLFEGPHNEGADGSAGTLGAVPQPIMKRLGNIDGGSDGHDMIVSRRSTAPFYGIL
jgi:hypothetical protein